METKTIQEIDTTPKGAKSHINMFECAWKIVFYLWSFWNEAITQDSWASNNYQQPNTYPDP